MRAEFVAALLLAVPAIADVRILSVEPTALFPRATPLRQVAIVSIWNDGSAAVGVELSARVVGGESGPGTKLTLPEGASRQRVLVPDLTSPGEVEVALKSNESTASWKGTWQPQRKWKVYVIKSSHEDLGYEGYIFHKQHDIAEFIDLAREMSGPRENVTELERKTDSRFHYTMETLLFQRNYIEERGDVAWRSIVEKDIKTGRMHLMGAPSGVHSHWMDYEELARTAYPARRENRDRYGLNHKTYMIVDNPSMSWSGAQVLADAGFRYIARWGQGWRTGGNNNYRTTSLPALFWWKAPDNFHRVLFGWRSHYGLSFWYGQTGGGYGQLIDPASENVSQQLKKIESGSELGPYPYDAVINPEYTDHDTPRFDSRVLPVWTQRYAYPEIHIGNPDDFFEYIEKKYGADLPELTGDLNNFSADYATIDPESQGWKRRAARVLPFAEGLGALASRFDAGYILSPSFVQRTYTRFFDYDEHSWPTLPRASDVQLFNAAWVKKHEGRRTLEASEAALKETSAALLKNIATGPEPEIVVFNPLAHPRSRLVTISGDVATLTDRVSGEVTIAQKTKDGQSVFSLKNVPAFGYKLFQIGDKALSASSSLTAGEDRIGNQFYEVVFDRTTGAVQSIKEKSSGRELVDQKAPHQVNQLIYVHRKQRESKEGFDYSPVRAKRMEISKGPVRVDFDVWIEDEKIGASIHQTVTLYDGVKRIDFVNRLEHAKALYTDKFEERYCDNIYFAFPFAVNGGQHRVEYPGGVVRPYLDQLRWGSHDYLYANRWVDVSNSSHGVTLAPWNAGTFSFGGIRYNQFSIDYRPENSWIYGYAWSNRMAGLLVLSPNDANATIGYSMTSHDGDWNSGEAAAFGWNIASPLEAFRLAPRQSGTWREIEKSFVSVDLPNVQMTVMKNSEQPGRGQVLRFVETAGKSGEFVLTAPALATTKAVLCDLVENDLTALTVEGGKVRVPIRAYGYATLRLESGNAADSAPVVHATTIADDKIRLSWNRIGSDTAYNIYRSVDPNDPPVAQTLVARVKDTTFTDQGLFYKTRYHYRVAAVSANNLQGPASNLVSVETAGRNLAPPAVVSEFGVVRRSKDRLMVYCRSNPEPDIARYYLYRGETENFPISAREPLAVLEPAKYFLQLYLDSGLQPGKKYFYQVVAEDWAGNRQSKAAVASAITPDE